MNFSAITYVLSLLWMLLGLCMILVAATVGWHYDTPTEAWTMGLTALVPLAIGITAFLIFRRKKDATAMSGDRRMGYATVGLAWLSASVLGALPFVTVSHFTPVDAIFETASGLTTTGASIIDNTQNRLDGKVLEGGLESLPRCILFWRSTLNWLGGVGIVYFVLLVLPLLHLSQGKQLYNAEVPGIKTSGDQLTPRLNSSVLYILLLYIAITATAGVTYWICGMSPFDAINHAFTTISTGGFSTKAASLGAFGPAVQWSVTFFMLVSACNFSLYLRFIITRRFSCFRDEEFRFFCAMILAATAIITACLMMKPGNKEPFSNMKNLSPIKQFELCLRTAAFHVATVGSTTGFTTSDYEQWGEDASKDDTKEAPKKYEERKGGLPTVLIILGILMFPCGCGGSTAGGMKCSRLIVLAKQLLYEIKHCIFPRSLPDIRLNGERLNSDIVAKTFAFTALYFCIFLIVAVLLTLVEQCGLKTAMGTSLSAISNVGPGFGHTCPSYTFSWMTDFSKCLTAFTMIIGRLELYT
ncbi:MAG: TrkH family potassium uptake protein, partial [Victivallales bacterium]|nr:TrkH family potassium uptake protein [Victivallales bacterium]